MMDTWFDMKGAIRVVGFLLVGALMSGSSGAIASERGGGGGFGGIGLWIDLSERFADQHDDYHEGPRRRRRVVRKPLVCEKPMVYYKRRHRCICPRRKGLELRGGKCVPKVPPEKVVHVQKCLKTAGFSPGPADGKAGRRTFAAFREFQEAYDLVGRPRYIYDKPTVERLFEICESSDDYGLVKAQEENSNASKMSFAFGGATIPSLD